MMAWIKRSLFHEFSFSFEELEELIRRVSSLRVDLSSVHEFNPFSITFKIESLSKIIHGISETIIQPVLRVPFDAPSSRRIYEDI